MPGASLSGCWASKWKKLPETDECIGSFQIGRTSGRKQLVFLGNEPDFPLVGRSPNWASGVGRWDATTFSATSYGKPTNRG